MIAAKKMPHVSQNFIVSPIHASDCQSRGKVNDLKLDSWVKMFLADYDCDIHTSIVLIWKETGMISLSFFPIILLYHSSLFRSKVQIFLNSNPEDLPKESLHELRELKKKWKLRKKCMSALSCFAVRLSPCPEEERIREDKRERRACRDGMRDN